MLVILNSLLDVWLENICGQLKRLTTCSKVFENASRPKCDKEVRITALTETKLRLQIAGMIGRV